MQRPRSAPAGLRQNCRLRRAATAGASGSLCNGTGHHNGPGTANPSLICQRATDSLQRDFHTAMVDIQMRAGTGTIAAGRRKGDALPADALGKLVRGEAGAGGVEEHQVGFGFLHRDARDLRQALGEGTGVRMIVREAVDVVIERVDTGGCTDTCLAQRPAEALLPAPGRVDELLRATQYGAQWRAKAFGEIDPDGIAMSGHVAR